MTEHPLELLRGSGGGPGCKPKHPLGELDSDKFSRHLAIFRPTLEGLAGLVDQARASIPALTDNEIVRRVCRYNQDSLWAIARKHKFNPAAPVGDGFIAFLFLNEAGLYQLATGALNTRDPDLSLLCGPTERPAGIYTWAVYAPGSLAAGVAPILK